MRTFWLNGIRLILEGRCSAPPRLAGPFGSGVPGRGRSLFKFPFLTASHKRALDAMDGGTVTPNISDTTRSLFTSCELLKDSAGDREGGRP